MKYIFLSILLSLGLSSVAQHIHSDSLSKHVHYLASDELQGRALGTAGKDLATAYILDQFKSAGLQPYEGKYLQGFDLNFRLAWVQASNIIGVVPGSDSDLSKEYIVIGAHYDHLGYKKDGTVFPGADDNASGVATIIELAKYFGQAANRPKRSLLFIAFDAEESGLLGAKHFVDNLSDDAKRQIKAMFSLDMVGMLRANRGLDLKGIATILDGKAIAERNAQDINLLNLSGEIERRTDTHPFGLQGIPAVHVFTGLKSPYHKPEDKADLLDYTGMAAVGDFMTRLLMDLAAQSKIEPVSALDRVAGQKDMVLRPLRLGVTGYLGTGRHLYKDEFFDAKSEVSFSLGMQLNYKFRPRFAVQLEGLYDQNASASQEGRFVRHAVLVPLNLQFGQMAYVEAGPYFKYHFDGDNEGTALDFDEVYRQQEWGYNLGLGMRVSHFQFGVVRRGAFRSIFQDGSKVIPTAVYFNLGYIF